MYESYGYYDYGDIKAKIIDGIDAYGSYIIPTNKAVTDSKQALSVLYSINKSLETTLPIKVNTSSLFCYSTSLNKSANINYYYNPEIIESFECNVIDDHTFNINLSEFNDYIICETVGMVKKHTFIINTNVSNANIIINGVQTSEYIGYDTEEINYEITADGYAKILGKFILLENYTLNAELKEEVFLTINTIPEDATVIINGQEGKTVGVPKGEEIEYTISAIGYVTLTEKITIIEDTVIDKELKALLIQVNYPQEALPSCVTTSGIGSSSSYAFYKTSSDLRSSSGSYHVNNGTSFAYLVFKSPSIESEFSVTCYVSSEVNYDYGMVYLGTKLYNPDRNAIKNGTTDGSGEYLFNKSGSISSATYKATVKPNTTYYICLKYAKDGSGNTGSDRFFIQNLSFKCME